jgi:hypothetical protein
MADELKEPVDLFAEFAFSESKGASGVWFPLKKGRVLIGSYSGQAFRNAHDLLKVRYPTAESLKSEEAQLRYEEILARHILLGWENIEPPYSFEAAKKALHLRSFREWVMQNALADENFRPDEPGIIKN